MERNNPDKCHWLVQGRQCKLNKEYPVENPQFCYHHYQRSSTHILPHEASPSDALSLPLPTQLEDLSDDMLRDLCEVLYQQHKYRDLINFTIIGKRVHTACQQTISRAKKTYFAERRVQIRRVSSCIKRHVLGQPWTFDVKKITNETTPNIMFLIANSPNYHITDDVGQGFTLIHWLLYHNHLIWFER